MPLHFTRNCWMAGENKMIWNELKENRIFIGGHRRTGTTLLSSLLEGHPSLWVYPHDTHFWYSFYPEWVNKPREEQIDRIVNFILPDLKQIMKKWIKVSDVEEQYNNIIKTFNWALHQCYGTKDLFDKMCYAVREVLSIQTSYQRQEYNEWIVTKDTTSSEFYVNKIFEMYPKAKFIHVIRDPKDNYTSILSGWDKHYKNQYDCKERLFRDFIDRGYLSMYMANHNRCIYRQDRYLVIRYEDLVNSTKFTMKRIAEFIGIDHNKFNLIPTFYGMEWKGNSFNEKHNGINKNRIGTYKKVLTEDQIKVIEFYFERLMSIFDYQTDYVLYECMDAVRRHYTVLNSLGQHYNKSYRENYES